MRRTPIAPMRLSIALLALCGSACTTRTLIPLPFGDGGVDTDGSPFFFLPDGGGDFFDSGPFGGFDSGFGTGGFDSGSCERDNRVSFHLGLTSSVSVSYTGNARVDATDPIRLDFDDGDAVEVILTGRYRSPALQLDDRVRVVMEVDPNDEGVIALYDIDSNELVYAIWRINPVTANLPSPLFEYLPTACPAEVNTCGGRRALALHAHPPLTGTLVVVPGGELTSTIANIRVAVGNGESVDVSSEPNPPCTVRPQPQRQGYYVVEHL